MLRLLTCGTVKPSMIKREKSITIRKKKRFTNNTTSTSSRTTVLTKISAVAMVNQALNLPLDKIKTRKNKRRKYKRGKRYKEIVAIPANRRLWTRRPKASLKINAFIL